MYRVTVHVIVVDQSGGFHSRKSNDKCLIEILRSQIRKGVSENELNRTMQSVLNGMIECQICREQASIPLRISTCLHEFCSLCIRRWISHKRECPVCRTKTSLDKLIKCPDQKRQPTFLQETMRIEPSQLAQSQSSKNLGSISRETGLCPVCNLRVGTRLLNTHVNHCLTKQSAPSLAVVSRSNSVQSSKASMKRLPTVVYNLLKDSKIRKLLADHNLSTSGSRKQLISRHKEFILRYNSNLDATSPKSILEIRNEICQWEQIRHNAPVKLKVPVLKKADKKKDVFRDLIRQYEKKHGKRKRPTRVYCSKDCLWNVEYKPSIDSDVYVNEKLQVVQLEPPIGNHDSCRQ